MKVMVTCGPGVAPIDDVRRISNVSTGELGVSLANGFAGAGHGVICLRSRASTTRLRLNDEVEEVDFETNEELGAALRSRGGDLILHAAALADFAVATVRNAGGNVFHSPKLFEPSGSGDH